MAQQPTAETTGVKNSSLSAAKRAKNDEFYTQLTDIEKELQHYKSHFKGKSVFLNCDPEWSNFWKYFKLNFEHLGLAKLVATHYAQGDSSYKLEYFGSGHQVETPLVGDGDFRSPECVELLQAADIVVTNPPFSLFREYVAQLVEHQKKFLIIGNNNAITYKEVFPLIKGNLVWLGHAANKTMEFQLSADYAKWDRVDERGNKFGKVPAISWFTNLPHDKRNEELISFRTYTGNEQSYPRYDNYDAIEVSKVSDIPGDYEGAMGVPITFLDKYNPSQFEIVGSYNSGEHGAELGAVKSEVISNGKPLMWNGPAVGKRPLYKRIVIRRKFKTEEVAP